MSESEKWGTRDRWPGKPHALATVPSVAQWRRDVVVCKDSRGTTDVNAYPSGVEKLFPHDIMEFAVTISGGLDNSVVLDVRPYKSYTALCEVPIYSGAGHLYVDERGYELPWVQTQDLFGTVSASGVYRNGHIDPSGLIIVGDDLRLRKDISGENAYHIFIRFYS